MFSQTHLQIRKMDWFIESEELKKALSLGALLFCGNRTYNDN